jgi:hypothetical protein
MLEHPKNLEPVSTPGVVHANVKKISIFSCIAGWLYMSLSTVLISFVAVQLQEPRIAPRMDHHIIEVGKKQNMIFMLCSMRKKD